MTRSAHVFDSKKEGHCSTQIDSEKLCNLPSNKKGCKHDKTFECDCCLKHFKICDITVGELLKLFPPREVEVE